MGATTFGHAMKELGQGKKRTHWMWYVFPQALGLSPSRLGATYAIKSVAEARSYLAHPVLGRRLKDATQAVLDCGKTDVHSIFGSPDDEKFKSCLTLFGLAEEDGFFKNAAQKFWPDLDGRTLDIWQRFPDYAPPKPANPPAPMSVPADGGNDQGEEGNDKGKDDGNNGGQGSNKESNKDDAMEDDDDIEDYLPHDMFDPDNMQPEGEVWEVVRIRASKICMGMLQYQVDWKDGDVVDEEDEEWYPAANLKGAAPKLDEFHTAHPEKPGPPLRLGIWKEAFAKGVMAGPHSDDNRSVASLGRRRMQRREAANARWLDALRRARQLDRTSDASQTTWDPDP